MSAQGRQYDLVLFGATGYTGKLTAEYIAGHLPTDLKWAIAGRNHKKLSDVAQLLKNVNADRIQPEIEVAELNSADLNALAKKTRLLITTTGPYHIYGTPVLAACVENGTHYIDCTGEVPWVKDMTDKYHETAKANKSICIPLCGIDSVPSDIIAWTLVDYIRQKFSCGVKDIVNSLQDVTGAPSGGTLSTAITLFNTYTPAQLLASLRPHSLSPIPAPTHSTPAPGSSLTATLLGVRTIPPLGILTDSPQGTTDAAVVHRSWALFDAGQHYGATFGFTEWMRVRSVRNGALFHFATLLFTLGMMVPPLRWLAARWATQPGQGPQKEAWRKDRLGYKAVAEPESGGERGPGRATATFAYKGGHYWFTGLFMAEAAMVVLGGEECLAKRLGGGILTPATLEGAYVERLKRAGVKLEVGMLEGDGAGAEGVSARL